MPVTIWKTRTLVSKKLYDKCRLLESRIDSDIKTLKFYGRNNLLGCVRYYAIKKQLKWRVEEITRLYKTSPNFNTLYRNLFDGDYSC